MDLEYELSNIIDSSWHYSWHWPRDQYGYLTLDGWRKALIDGNGLLAHFEQRIAELKKILPLIEEEIKKRANWEAEI
jgi:hypothetical protein